MWARKAQFYCLARDIWHRNLPSPMIQTTKKSKLHEKPLKMLDKKNFRDVLAQLAHARDHLFHVQECLYASPQNATL